MKKFMTGALIVFLLGIWAEWVILSNPTKGVVLGMEHQINSDDFKLLVLNSEGLPMQIRMPAKVWQEWFQRRVVTEK